MRPARDVVQKALRAALAAADPESILGQQLNRSGDQLHFHGGGTIDLSCHERVWIVGAGKATPKLARALLGICGERVAGGTIATKEGYALPLPLDCWEAGHPTPDIHSLAAAAEALALVRSCGPTDLLICLLSGGASALWSAPAPGLSSSDLREVTSQLLRSGAPIQEMNTVRKHLSGIAGGRLAQHSRAGRLVTIAISDVLGDDPAVIGSGPTAPHASTFEDALRILGERELPATPAVRRFLRAGATGRNPETPKASAPFWKRTSYHLIASLHTAIRESCRSLESSGYRTRIVNDRQEGEAREVGREIARRAMAVARGAGESCALLWGGETTVSVRGSGRGGRNQELALAAALEIAGDPQIVIASFATDGTDGPTEAAGAIIDGQTCARGAARGLDARAALAENDAYTFLDASGDLLRTGPTGTNVNDIMLALITPREPESSVTGR